MLHLCFSLCIRFLPLILADGYKSLTFKNETRPNFFENKVKFAQRSQSMYEIELQGELCAGQQLLRENAEGDTRYAYWQYYAPNAPRVDFVYDVRFCLYFCWLLCAFCCFYSKLTGWETFKLNLQHRKNIRKLAYSTLRGLYTTATRSERIQVRTFILEARISKIMVRRERAHASMLVL